MKLLNDVGVRFATDKSSLNHHYLGLYELLFDKFPAARILEIGIQFGNSLKTWQDYFYYSAITGIDIVDNGVHIDGVEIVIADAYTPQTLEKLKGREFDIIIDDADHSPEHQAYAIQHYSSLLSPLGILIVEDVNCPISVLKAALPEGFNYTAVEMIEGNSTMDSKLFIVWKS